jgi:hypothetical protein
MNSRNNKRPHDDVFSQWARKSETEWQIIRFNPSMSRWKVRLGEARWKLGEALARKIAGWRLASVLVLKIAPSLAYLAWLRDGHKTAKRAAEPRK